MESLRGTFAEMSAQFHDRMARFEAEQQNSASPSLPPEYLAFKKFTLESLRCIQQQMDSFTDELDSVEMRSRRKILLIHGVPENTSEDTASVVANVIHQKLSLPTITALDIRRCHRVGGRAHKSKPRPILVKMKDADIRDKVWYSKTKLKGSGITVSEFLTKIRHQVFVAARDKFGVANCWTKRGDIYVLGSDGVRHRIVSHSQLRALGEPAAVPERSAAVVPKKKTRGAAKK